MFKTMELTDTTEHLTK